MKRNDMKGLWVTLGLLIGLNSLIAWGMWGLPGFAQEPKRFQYRVVDAVGDSHTLQAILNDHGSAGWELVAVAIGDIQVPRLIFKK